MTVAQRVNAERLVLFGWSRAILLQLAHPLIAAGVSDHSSFRAGPATAARRLHGTVRSMLWLTFGTDAQRDETIARIRDIHTRVNGALESSVGTYPAGTRYSAEDPALLLWVHATLLDSVCRAYDLLVGPLTPADRDQYCRDAAPIAAALGAIDADLPRSWADLQRYLTGEFERGAIAVGPVARELADAVLSPPMKPLTFPFAALNRVITIGMLPAEVRGQFGFAWGPAGETRLARWAAAIRTVRRISPDVIAQWTDARTKSG